MARRLPCTTRASLLQIWGGFAPTAVSNKLYQLFVHGRWFSPGTPTSTTKTGRHDIAEILLKVAVNVTHCLLLFLVDKFKEIAVVIV
jgi:hypothetical protein